MANWKWECALGTAASALFIQFRYQNTSGVKILREFLLADRKAHGTGIAGFYPARLSCIKVDIFDYRWILVVLKNKTSRAERRARCVHPGDIVAIYWLNKLRSLHNLLLRNEAHCRHRKRRHIKRRLCGSSSSQKYLWQGVAWRDFMDLWSFASGNTTLTRRIYTCEFKRLNGFIYRVYHLRVIAVVGHDKKGEQLSCNIVLSLDDLFMQRLFSWLSFGSFDADTNTNDPQGSLFQIK